MIEKILIEINIEHDQYCNRDFVDKCVKIISDHIDREGFNMQMLADLLHLSNQTFYPRVKAITGLNRRDFIRTIKMQVAYQMLLTKNYRVSEVAWRCGYSSPRHFSKVCF